MEPVSGKSKDHDVDRNDSNAGEEGDIVNEDVQLMLEKYARFIETRVKFSKNDYKVLNFAVQNDLSDGNIRRIFGDMWSKITWTDIVVSVRAGFLLCKTDPEDGEITYRYFWAAPNTNILPKKEVKFENKASLDTFLEKISTLKIEKKLRKAHSDSRWKIAYITNLEFHVFR